MAPKRKKNTPSSAPQPKKYKTRTNNDSNSTAVLPRQKLGIGAEMPGE